MELIKGNKFGIGGLYSESNVEYSNHKIAYNHGDIIYLFTDGYADQFGGAKDKKYSTARFKNLLIKNSNEDFATQEKNIRTEHQDWKGDNEQVDDILVIGFTV